MNNTQILYKPFDINVHAENFINYLEVIIRPNGQIEYAVPSHVMKLEQIVKDQEHLSQEEFIERTKAIGFEDYIQWLCNESKCVSVWDEFCVKPKEGMTPDQDESLVRLSRKRYSYGQGKLYRGNL